jgi:hypothetical protein
MSAGLILPIIIAAVVFARCALAAIAPDLALRLLLKETNLFLRTGQLRAAPDHGTIDAYIAQHRRRTRFAGIAGILVCGMLLILFLVSRK